MVKGLFIQTKVEMMGGPMGAIVAPLDVEGIFGEADFFGDSLFMVILTNVRHVVA